MAGPSVALPEVAAAQITLVMDNSIDVLMASTDVAKRFLLWPNPFERPQPMAEHGFSALIRVQQGEKSGTILFDTGVSRRGILPNLDALEIDAADIRAVVLSHGHADHALGLPGLVERLGQRNLPLVRPWVGRGDRVRPRRNHQHHRTRPSPHRRGYVYTVLGSFHLTGGLFEPIIPATTAALQRINPRYIMPGHCTGWSATHQLARAMPGAFIPSSVGTTLML